MVSRLIFGPFSISIQSWSLLELLVHSQANPIIVVSKEFSFSSRFKTFGGRDPHRPAEDVAYSVARFFQKGGSVHNYYMVNGS